MKLQLFESYNYTAKYHWSEHLRIYDNIKGQLDNAEIKVCDIQGSTVVSVDLTLTIESIKNFTLTWQHFRNIRPNNQ
jgi:hypothetical protein